MPARVTGSEAVEAGYFFGSEGEAEEIEVLLDAFRAGGLGDHDDADVEVPAQDHLGGGHAVLGCYLGQRAVCEDHVGRHGLRRGGDAAPGAQRFEERQVDRKSVV